MRRVHGKKERKKMKKKMTHEDFRRRVRMWGWLCKFFPHHWVSADNEVVSGTALCLNCGAVVATSKVRRNDKNT